jgi:hypothetical protein
VRPLAAADVEAYRALRLQGLRFLSAFSSPPRIPFHAQAAHDRARHSGVARPHPVLHRGLPRQQRVRHQLQNLPSQNAKERQENVNNWLSLKPMTPEVLSEIRRCIIKDAQWSIYIGSLALAQLINGTLKKTGQVNIMVRDVQGVGDNPFDFNTVKKNIEIALKDFKNRVKIELVPNITNICYGRSVGYKIEEIVLSEELQKISATEIRKKMREES